MIAAETLDEPSDGLTIYVHTRSLLASPIKKQLEVAYSQLHQQRRTVPFQQVKND